MGRYIGRAKNVYVVEYPKEGNVPGLKHQLQRLEIPGFNLNSAGLYLDYQSGTSTLRIFMTPGEQELRHGRHLDRAEFLLLSSSNSPYAATDMESALDSIVGEVNTKLKGIQLESLGAFWVRQRSFGSELRNLVAILKDVFSSPLFFVSLITGLALVVYLAFTIE